jgi:hypothetical protein
MTRNCGSPTLVNMGMILSLLGMFPRRGHCARLLSIGTEIGRDGLTSYGETLAAAESITRNSRRPVSG